ncbi:MAG: hypothetical protein FWB85_08380 [Chitinispirillia bacterium]|nr:hypothetical protein [Chitinispirillia bacterium]MCL2241739.1 hypothetical protein [Chitinispirillia bacterium]
MRIKPKNILSGLTVLWVLVVIFEALSSVIRLFYCRKMHTAVKAVSGAVNWAKAAMLIVLAVSNVVLFMRHVDDKG